MTNPNSEKLAGALARIQANARRRGRETRKAFYDPTLEPNFPDYEKGPKPVRFGKVDAMIKHLGANRPDVVFTDVTRVNTFIAKGPPDKNMDQVVVQRFIQVLVPKAPYNKHRSKRLQKKLDAKYGFDTKVLALPDKIWRQMITKIMQLRKGDYISYDRK